MDTKCDLEELSYSLQLCDPFSVSTINPSTSSIAQDISSSDIISGAFDSTNIIEISRQRDDEGNGKVRLDESIGIKFHENTCSSPPRRSARVTKFNQNNLSRKAAKRCDTAVIRNELLDSFFGMERKSRSCECRPARTSVWGSVGITKYFDKSASKVVNKGNKKSEKIRGVRGSVKGKNEQVATSVQVSNGKTNVSLGRLRIKVKLSKEMGGKCMTDMVSAKKNEEANREPLVDIFPKKEAKISGSGENLDNFIADNHKGISFPVDGEGPGDASDNKYLDLGTSPDSEVINLIPETQINGKEPEDFHDVQISSQTPADIPALSLQFRRRNKKKKSDNTPSACNFNEQDTLDRHRILDKASLIEKCGQGGILRDGFDLSEASIITSTANLSSNNTSSSEGSHGELLPLSITGDVENIFSCSKDKGQKHLKNSKPKKRNKGGSEGFEAPRSQRENAIREKGSAAKSIDKKKTKAKAACGEFARTVKDYHEAGYNSLDFCEIAKTVDGGMVQEKNNIDVAGENREQKIDVGVANGDAPRNAWVLCDDCSKWRRIPAILADSIDETDSRWTCKENVDKDFADCSIPQEKSNSEINAELEISDAEDAGNDGSNPKGTQLYPLGGHERSSWKLIKSNKFMHRNRRSQTIDEIMVCHCKPPSNGKLGCGNGCLNRMLNIECVRGTCPCGERCSNQQFQKRKYAKLKWFRCGKKGYGLQLLEDISEGQFLIEYIGEVLDMHAYEARQRDYASQGHKHFYFMTLNGSEVIDACAKGNLGRFINHSCDPNCRTEKWMVNGEVCVGLFALKDLKKGEEVTFDYNYVRVFGAAAKRCVCGASHCRGYIGGDPRNSDIIVQGDSDDEFPEPVMVCDDGEIDDSSKNLVSAINALDDPKTTNANAEQVIKCEEKLEKAETIVDHLDGTKEVLNEDVLVNDDNKNDDSMDNIQHLGEICRNSESERLQISFNMMENPTEALQHSIEKPKSPPQLDIDLVGTISDPRQAIISSPVATPLTVVNKKTVSNSSKTKKKQKSDKNEDRRTPKSKSLMKTSVKKGKSSSTNSGNLNKSENVVNKSPGMLFKLKKITEGSASGRFGVEEKLNELLDVDGGISKKQDAAQGYLKLLILTAASGDSVSGEAIQSNRDLSMILGAIWKTKSRSVLVDIISKNGLQMLHNMLKQCRRDFSRIPILRKLLKVLEFLATKEILTMELINKEPSCEGVESFKESILALTEHDDKQVHQIARNFRDRWIPWSLRRNIDFRRSSHNQWRERNSQTRDTINENKQSSPANVSVPVDIVMNEVCSSSCNSGTRKRKSRWDQPPDSDKEPKLQKDLNINEKSNADDEGAHMDEDAPPGFGPHCNASSLTSGNNFPCKVEIGHPQEKFMNRLSVSYGIPMPIVQQLGYPKTDGLEDWFIAPGVPFQPYPPLPNYSRNISDNMRDYRGHQSPMSQSDHNPPSTSGMVSSDFEIQGMNNCHNFQKANGSQGMGRYFRQQKGNNSRLPPPWKRNKNRGRDFTRNDSRNRVFGNQNGGVRNMETYPDSFPQYPQQEGYY